MNKLLSVCCAMIGGLALSFNVSADATLIDEGATLHLDSSSGRFNVTVDSNGVYNITRWFDARKTSSAAADAGKPFSEQGYKRCKAYPKLISSELLNGRAVVDCGDYSERQGDDSENPSGADSAYFTFPRASYKTGFLVFRTKPSTKNGAFFLGDLWEYRFHRGGGGEILDSQNAAAYINGGTWHVDKTEIDAGTYVLDNDFHLVSFSLNVGMEANTLTFDRDASVSGIRCGGVEYAEVLLFTDTLAPERYAAIESALYNKWFGETAPESTVAISRLSYGADTTFAFTNDFDVTVSYTSKSGTLVKSGEGALDLVSAPNMTGVDVAEGTLALSGDIVRTAFFHMDPSDSSTYELDGDGRVATIFDVGNNGRSATRDYYSKRNPKLVVDPVSGLNTLDFGKFYVDSNGQLGNAPETTGAFTISEKGVGLHTFFVVVGLNDDTDMHILGTGSEDGNAPFDRANKNLIDPTWAVYDTNVAAKWWLDGKVVDALNTKFPTEGLHLITVAIPAANSGVNVNFFARSSLYRIGGLTYGEVMLFQNRLDDAEILEINNMLLEKWLKQEQPTFEETMKTAFFHIDPNDSTTLTKEGDIVTSITDVRKGDGAITATVPSGTAITSKGPTLVASGENKLLDFGPYHVVNGGPMPEDTSAFVWSKGSSAIKAGFIVIEKKSADHDSFLLGGWNDNEYDFHADGGTFMDGQNAYGRGRNNAQPVWSADWTLDGVPFDPNTTAWVNDGLHVVSFRVKSGTALASAFALDRYNLGNTIRTGGLRYGEVIIFEEEPSAAMAQAIDDYLVKKWLGKTIEHAPVSGTLPADTTVRSGAKLDYTGNLLITDGAELKFSSPTVDNGVIAVDGNFNLGSNVKVVFDQAGSKVPSGKIALIKATSLTGVANLGSWTASGTGIVNDKYAFSADETTVYIELPVKGLTVIIR